MDREILEKRIAILQAQLTKAKKSGAKVNMLGQPIDDQIKVWENEIRKATRRLKAI